MTDDTDTEVQAAAAAEFLALADLLERAPGAWWDTPSLCEGWRVREVVAHMTMAARYSQEAFMALLAEHGFDFTRLSDAVAARDGALPTGELAGCLRSEVMQRWQPPGGGAHGALNHVVIHGLDITVPLGAERRVPAKTLGILLDDLTTGGGHARFGVAVEGRRLRATDLDWSYGSGPELRGTGEDLALAMCGRRLPAGRLEGEPL
ncbi:maleylpyruvate isomerase family mycothiol-dependent enzyme [Streptomyces sp. NPDC058864]